MKTKLYLLSLITLFFLASCGGASEKATDENATTEEETKSEETATKTVEVPNIDVEALNDEQSILDAMEKVVTGRMEDEKLRDENPDYKGNYIEFTKLYSAVLKKSTEFQKSMKDPKEALAFNEKIKAITDRMYQK